MLFKWMRWIFYDIDLLVSVSYILIKFYIQDC